jgi:hypothetical protein
MTRIEWRLGSGLWTSDQTGARDSFLKADVDEGIAALSPAAQRQLGTIGEFPVEFQYDPVSGEPIVHESPNGLWCTPDGGRAINDKFIGLSMDAQTRFNAPAIDKTRRVISPGIGRFEFIVGRFGTRRQQLLSVNTVNHDLQFLLDGQWVELKCPHAEMPEGFAHLHGWRAELFETAGQASRLDVPTDEGVRVLLIDARKSSFGSSLLNPPGFARLCGAPLYWDVDGTTGVAFPYVDQSGRLQVATVTDHPTNPRVETVAPQEGAEAPVDGEFCRWAFSARQMRFWIAEDRYVRWGPRGALVQRLPRDHRVAWESLHPFIDSHGKPWLPVHSESAASNVFVRIGDAVGTLEMKSTDRLYLCSGQRFFRKDLVFQKENPWTIDNEAQDTTSHAHIVPLIDFHRNESSTRPDCALALHLVTDVPEPWVNLWMNPDRELYFRLMLGSGREPLMEGKLPRLLEDARAFVFDGAVYFHSGPRLELQGWPLE